MQKWFDLERVCLCPGGLSMFQTGPEVRRSRVQPRPFAQLGTALLGLLARCRRKAVN